MVRRIHQSVKPDPMVRRRTPPGGWDVTAGRGSGRGEYAGAVRRAELSPGVGADCPSSPLRGPSPRKRGAGLGGGRVVGGGGGVSAILRLPATINAGQTGADCGETVRRALLQTPSRNSGTHPKQQTADRVLPHALALRAGFAPPTGSSVASAPDRTAGGPPRPSRESQAPHIHSDQDLPVGDPGLGAIQVPRGRPDQ